MRRTAGVGVLMGLAVLTAAPAAIAPAGPGPAPIEVQAALDMFLDLRPVCGEVHGASCGAKGS